jgi:hypothetical protein
VPPTIDQPVSARLQSQDGQRTKKKRLSGGTPAQDRLDLRHSQPPLPVHIVRGPLPCSPGCSNRTACAVPLSGSPDGPPTCGHRVDPESSLGEAGCAQDLTVVDFQGSAKQQG